MKEMKFDNLIARAKQDIPPAVDVADDVIARLATMAHRTMTDPYRPYVWMSAASAAIAACILIAATLTLQNNADGVSEMITYVSWIAQ